MYGQEYGSVMGKGTCARCNSTTSLRGLQRTGTDIIVCHATCNKCHHIEFIGFTSVQEVAHQAVKQKLQKMHEEATSPVAKERIAHKLHLLEEKKKFDDLGL